MDTVAAVSEIKYVIGQFVLWSSLIYLKSVHIVEACILKIPFSGILQRDSQTDRLEERTFPANSAVDLGCSAGRQRLYPALTVLIT